MDIDYNETEDDPVPIPGLSKGISLQKTKPAKKKLHKLTSLDNADEFNAYANFMGRKKQYLKDDLNISVSRGKLQILTIYSTQSRD